MSAQAETNTEWSKQFTVSAPATFFARSARQPKEDRSSAGLNHGQERLFGNAAADGSLACSDHQ